MPFPTYKLEVDWADDGSFATAGDDITADLFDASISRQFADPLARVASAGSAVFTVDNRTKKYSPAFTANTLPRRQVRFSMTYSAVTKYLFTGYLDEIEPEAGIAEGRRAQLRCIDALTLLDTEEAKVAMLEGATADQVISAIVAATYTPPSTDYETGLAVFPFSADRWSQPAEMGVGFEKTTAARKIQDACVSDWGRFYISGAGAPTFRNRHYLSLNSTTALTLSGTTQSLNYRKTAANIYNLVEVTCQPRLIGDTVEVIGKYPTSAQATARPRLEVGVAQKFILAYRDPSDTSKSIGGKSGITPVPALDFVVTADEPGTGADISASITISATFYSDRAEVTLTNGTAALAFLQSLQVRGYAVRVRERVTMTATASAAVRRKLSLTAPLMASTDHAQRLADHLLDYYSTPRDIVSNVSFEAYVDATRLAAARDFELMQRIVVTEPQTGLTSYAGYVFALTHSISAKPRSHRVTFSLETAYPVSTPFRIGVSALNSGHVLLY